MTSEALQNPYFVRLYCKNIDKTHFLTEPNDKIQFHGNYFFTKRGGGPLWKGGGTDPLFPPPLNPPLLLLSKDSEVCMYTYVTCYLVLYLQMWQGNTDYNSIYGEHMFVTVNGLNLLLCYQCNQYF